MCVFVLLASCSPSRQGVPSKFILSNMGALAFDNSGGGLLLKGKSDKGESFLVGLYGNEVFNYEKELDPGAWSFYAITWDGTIPMTGTNHCGFQNIEISGESAEVRISLETQTCLDPSFVATPGHDGTGVFRPLSVQACLTLQGLDPNNAGGSCPAHLMPEASSYRIRLRTHDSTSSSKPPTLTSHCFGLTFDNHPTSDIPDFGQTMFQTNLLLPFGGEENLFPFEILAYDDINCVDFKKVYRFDNVNYGTNLSQNRYRLNTGGPIAIFSFPDNFMDYGGTPLLSHALDIKCGTGPCHGFDVSTSTLEDIMFMDQTFEDLLRLISPVIPHPYLVAFHELDGNQASYNYNGIEFWYYSAGEEGNGFQITFTRNDSLGEQAEVIDSGSNFVQIEFMAGATYEDIDNALDDGLFAGPLNWEIYDWGSVFDPMLANG